jgi:Mn-dependent DtxR family transcriptional regulator
MVMRSIRFPASLWDEAKATADEREENLSDVLRDALRRYVKRHTRKDER